METLMMECVSRYCAIKGRSCEIEVPEIPEKSCFVAYPFEQPFADIATFLDDKLSTRGYRMEVPRASRSATGLLFCNFICPMILRSRMVIGEVTDPNRNVFFELGYAYGLGKEVYLVRNTGLERKSNPILKSGIYVHHYGAPEELIDSFTGRESKLRPMLFDEPAGETVPGSVAVLIPNHSHHQSVIGDAIHACVQANNMVPAEEVTDGIALLRQYRLIQSAEWALGDLVSDEAVGSQDLNCETAFLLGVSLALGKKMVIVQEAPVAKPMIDLAGLLEVYHGVEDLTRILTRKLDVQADTTVRRIDRSDGPVDADTERRQLSRAEIGSADDESIFEAMNPGIPANSAFKTSKATELESDKESPPSQDMEEPDLAKRVKEIIAENLGVQESEVRNSTRLEADLGADELDEVEIIMALEESFDIEITDEEAEARLGSFGADDADDPTVASLISLVARKVAE